MKKDGLARHVNLVTTVTDSVFENVGIESLVHFVLILVQRILIEMVDFMLRMIEFILTVMELNLI